MKVTIDLEPDLWRAIKVEAARADRSVRDLVDEALAGWLERHEEEEDREAATAALEEYGRLGGTAADELFARHAAETRERYGADPPA